MRRLIMPRTLRLVAALLLILALAAMPGCRRRKRPVLEALPEADTQSTLGNTSGSTPGSIVVMSDPRSSGQIVNGFYGIENQSWRWTAGKFSVLLRPPGSGAQ